MEWPGDPPRVLSQQFPNDDEDFTLLINALKTRFDGLPIHELCYFQGHNPTSTTLEKLEQAVEEARRTWLKHVTYLE